MGPRSIFIAIVAVFAIGMGTWLSYQLVVPPPEPRVATVLPATAALPEFSLVDQRGDAVTRDTFRGQWDLVFFGFTNCPDICPLTMQVLATALNQLAESDHAALPRIVLVSVDPERDSPELLQTYVASFGDNILGVTGDLAELQKLTKSLGIYFAKSFADDGNYTMDHSAVVLLINPDGALRALFSAPHDVENFVHDLPIVLAGS